MLTAGDIQFEPFQAKWFAFSKHVVGLLAGTSQSQISICNATLARLGTNTSPTVGEVANIYAEEFGRLRRARAESEYLRPLGLDQELFSLPDRMTCLRGL